MLYQVKITILIECIDQIVTDMSQKYGRQFIIYIGLGNFLSQHQ